MDKDYANQINGALLFNSLGHERVSDTVACFVLPLKDKT
jgi:hypothetical protein